MPLIGPHENFPPRVPSQGRADVQIDLRGCDFVRVYIEKTAARGPFAASGVFLFVLLRWKHTLACVAISTGRRSRSCECLWVCQNVRT